MRYHDHASLYQMFFYGFYDFNNKTEQILNKAPADQWDFSPALFYYDMIFSLESSQCTMEMQRT